MEKILNELGFEREGWGTWHGDSPNADIAVYKENGTWKGEVVLHYAEHKDDTTQSVPFVVTNKKDFRGMVNCLRGVTP